MPIKTTNFMCTLVETIKPWDHRYYIVLYTWDGTLWCTQSTMVHQFLLIKNMHSQTCMHVMLFCTDH